VRPLAQIAALGLACDEMGRWPFALALIIVALAIAVIVVEQPRAIADLENQVYTSKPDQLRMVVPRGWRATDQPSYPGLLLWMMHGQPDAHIVLTAEAFTRRQYCSWPIPCRTSHDSLQVKLACALRSQLEDAGRQQGRPFHIGPIQAGPKENELAGMPSVWFEYDDGKHFFRQAAALTDDRIVSLLLSTPSIDARTGYVRAFEQALRTLRPLTVEESAAAGIGTPRGADAGLAVAPGDGPVVDAGVLADAAVPAPATTGTFSSAPAAKVNPVGSCAQ
jgi:hypothetical protein